MKVIQLAEQDKEKYNAYVSSHVRGFFLQSWHWGDWQNHQGKTVERYFVEHNEKVIASAQVVINSSPIGNYYYSAYGPLWNEDLSPQEVDQAISELVKTLQSNKQIMFVRLEPVVQHDLKKLDGYKTEAVQPPQTLVVNIADEAEKVLQSFHSKTRYNIRIAQKHSVEIKTFSEPNTQVVDLIMQTSERKQYRNHARTYVERMWQFLSEHHGNLKATGYLALKDNQPIASALMIDFAKTRMYLFGGSDYNYRNLMSPFLLHWQAILDAKNSGLTQYDFGASENARGHAGSYMRFKMGFNPTILQFAGTFDFPKNKITYKAFSTLRKLNRTVKHLPFIR